LVSPFRRLLAYVRPYRRDFLLGLACVIGTTGIALTAPWLLKLAIDDLTAGITREKLTLYSAALLAVGVGGGVFRFLMRRILVGASRDIEYDMRNDFFAQLEQMPVAYFQARRTGDLMSRATNDLNAVRQMVGPAVMYSANTLLGFVVALILMLSIDARLTLFSLIPLPFVSLSVKFFGSAIHKRFEAIQAQLSDVSAIAQEALSGVRVVRAYRQEEAELERFRVANAEYLHRNRRLIVLQGFFFPSMAFFLGLGSMLVLWLGSADVIAGRITVGEFVAFNAYLTMLAWPMIAFGWVTNMIQRGMASWKRMLEVLDAEPAIKDETRTQREKRTQSAEAPSADTSSAPPPRVLGASALSASASSSSSASSWIRGEIEFRDLAFSYNGTPVLEHVSARIEAGQTVAFVGLTGSGKSTLISLLARLHDPPPGTVFVDGMDVRTIPLEGQAGQAGQAGRAGEDTEGAERRRRIEQAAAVARLDKDVADFPKGYDTIVGERGITLSGGQKQRTAIARAIVIDPRILILDDALSAVDTYTEEEILSRLRGVMRQRTSIIVSHRISTVRDADQIFVLDRGRIVERGTHDALIERDGLYATLDRKQLLEEELAAS
jgi:ATP-binding cassette subfamily B protein